MLQVDKEFKELIPRLSDDEYKRLEESLLEYGYDIGRGKIITWNGIIIDGHNRYEICTKHNIKFECEEKEFDSRTDIKIWIIKNQLSRRNINDFVRAELALQLKGEIAGKARMNQSLAGGDKKSEESLLPISAKAVIEPINTRAEIAKVAGVGKTTVAEVEKILESAPKHIKDKARSGEMKVHTAYKEMQRELNETQRCIVCGEEKPLADFHVRQDRNQRNNKCKQCENERKRVQKQDDGIDETTKSFKTESVKLGRYSFIMGGVSTLNSAIETVADDLKKYLNEVIEESERNQIKKQIQEQIVELEKLINLF